MNNGLFFPSLNRRPEDYYYCNTGGFYSNYQANYEKVAEDCKHRCVYCDATEKECGGERFSLDHFRPKDVFANKFNGILVKHPHNLHLSCQKCNVLKGKDWKGCEATVDGYTFIDGKGYIDRFNDDINQYLEIQFNGRMLELQSTGTHLGGPGKYMIKRLHLNRPNRVYLRQKRVVDKLVQDIEQLFSKLTRDVIKSCTSGKKSAEEGMLLIGNIEDIRSQFLELR